MAKMQRFRQAERVAARVIEGAAFVVSVDRQMLLELNEVGTFVWDRLAEPRTIEDLAREVAGEFEVEPEVARSDVESFLATLADRGAVSVEEAEGP